ncbi:hypothetical protein BH18THE2_BH18THE2_14990 [soil metagenome]
MIEQNSAKFAKKVTVSRNNSDFYFISSKTFLV